MKKVTISLIKADVGGFPGHATVHPNICQKAEEMLKNAVQSDLITDFHVMGVGDDLELIMGHFKGENNVEVHELAWRIFIECTDVAKMLKLYGAGQDLLKDAFAGTVRGLGPGASEMVFTERTGEPLVAFMMDKTEPGAFNLPLYRMFADPFNTAGLIIDPSMHQGFKFEIWDIKQHTRVFMECPDEMYSMLALIGSKSRYVIKRVWPREGHPKLPADEPVASISTEKLYEVAGEYVGKDDPVGLVRAQSGLPALGEVLEPWTLPHIVSGWMRGSHNGPIMPVGFKDARCTRFDGPPRVVAAGFQVANGMLHGPVDLFDDVAYDAARAEANIIANYFRRHGPFEPHRLPSEEMEYTTLPKVLKMLQGRFESID